MASATVSDPQSWNRYTYALNNPLKYIDPNGMEVPKDCANNPNCTIVLKVNVIYDKRVQFSRQDRQRLEKDFLKQAQKDFKKSNIKLEFSYSEGSFKRNADNTFTFEGMQSDKLNVYFSDHLPGSIKAGTSFNLTDGSSGIVLDADNVELLSTNMLYPLGTNTMEHEVGHHLLGHTSRKIQGQADYQSNEFWTDTEVYFQSWWRSSTAFRQGTEKKVYAVPANPELNKPSQQ
jgi:hypothetical protein